MPKVILVVSDEQKALWVEAAHAERLTLSEWIRRRCDGGLAAGEAGLDGSDPGTPGVRQRGTAVPTPQSPAASPQKLVAEPGVQTSAMQPGSGEDRDKPAAPHLEQLEAALGREATGAERALIEGGLPTPPARSVPQFRADPKEKAAQEHAPKERQRAKAQMCEHRVPLGQYCKRCSA